jgi:hypothetical protein
MYDIWFFLTHSDHESMWMDFKKRYPHARKKIIADNYEQALYECARDSLTSMFFTISDVTSIKQDFDFSFVPTFQHNGYIHAWTSNSNVFFDFNLLILWPKELVLSKHANFSQLLDNHVHHVHDLIYDYYDIFFISYNEEYADENWTKLKDRFPYAIRVDKILGIHNAHKKCALKSRTEMFYTVDADTIVDKNWSFTYQPRWYDKKYLHLWYTRNPVNGLEYGYGGIKLWPKDKVLSFDHPWIDFTAGVGDLKVMPDVISTTNFNTSPYSAWKSAFREGIKLQENIKKNPNDADSMQRFNTWSNVFLPVPFSNWVKHGIEDSVKFFNKHYSSIDNINDFEWLKAYFTNSYKDSI